MKTITTALCFLLALNNAFSNELIVANEGFEFPPFSSYVNADPLVKTGFEIELVNEISSVLESKNFPTLKIVHRYEDLNESFTFKDGEKIDGPIDWGDLLDGLYLQSSNQRDYAWDIALGTFGITEERKKIVDFTNAYFIPSKHFFGRRGQSISSLPDGLKDLRVGAEKGTLFEKYLVALKNDLEAKGTQTFTIITYESSNDLPAFEKMINDLKNDVIDSFVQDDEVFLEKKIEDKELEAFDMISNEITSDYLGETFGSGVGMAVRKGSVLKLVIDSALDQVIQSCRYQLIYEKYFLSQSPLSPSHCQISKN